MMHSRLESLYYVTCGNLHSLTGSADRLKSQPSEFNTRRRHV